MYLQVGALTALCLMLSFTAGIQSAGDARPASLIEAGSIASRGDLTGDGKLTIEDAIVVLELSEGYREPTTEELFADPNGDGELTVSDALWILSTVSLRS